MFKPEQTQNILTTPEGGKVIAHVQTILFEKTEFEKYVWVRQLEVEAAGEKAVTIQFWFFSLETVEQKTELLVNDTSDTVTIYTKIMMRGFDTYRLPREQEKYSDDSNIDTYIREKLPKVSEFLRSPLETPA